MSMSEPRHSQEVIVGYTVDGKAYFSFTRDDETVDLPEMTESPHTRRFSGWPKRVLYVPRNLPTADHRNVTFGGNIMRAWLLLSSLIILLVSGCGGGDGGSLRTDLGPASNTAAGRLNLTVTWPVPASGRLIPQAAQSIRATVTLGTTTVGTQLLARPI